MRCEHNKKTSHNTPTPKISKAYLLGALHDSTERKYTFRICQKYLEYIRLLAKGITQLGAKSRIYKEGKSRDLYVVEFRKSLLKDFLISTTNDKKDYIKGYFDTEGSIPRSFVGKYYLYFAQKNKSDIIQLRNYLLDVGFKCGPLHNPSKRIDQNYYRFHILSESWDKFYDEIGSMHPIKSKYLRKKI